MTNQTETKKGKIKWWYYLVGFFIFCLGLAQFSDEKSLSKSTHSNDSKNSSSESDVLPNNDFTTEGINIKSIIAKKGETRFSICLENPIPESESNGIDKVLDCAIFFTYKNGDTYYLEHLIGQRDDDYETTCFDNISKHQMKYGSGLSDEERTKVENEVSNENFKSVRVALVRSKYTENDTLAIKTFNFK